MKTLKSLAVLAAIVPLTSACATKKFVIDRIESTNARTDSIVAVERQERIAGDEALRADVVALRGSLDSLRNEFNVRMTAFENGIKFAFPVNFAFDDAAIRPEDQEKLQRFAQVANKYYQNAVITVEGFADPAGSTAYNLRLSQQRAENVRQYLLAQGLMAENLKAVGYGENRQVVRGATRDEPGAELNRRVVFVVEAQGPMVDAVAMGLPQEQR